MFHRFRAGAIYTREARFTAFAAPLIASHPANGFGARGLRTCF
jgi:hypothetical protein